MHSTSYGDTSQACFEAGLNYVLGSIPTITPFNANGDYSDAGLKAKLKSAVAASPNLIVTAGWLVIAKVAAAYLFASSSALKFVYLTGDALPGASPTGNVAGGVNMNCPGEDAKRRAVLKAKYSSVKDASMYLVVNDNAPMTPGDSSGWAHVFKFFTNVPNPPDPTSAFNTGFSNLFGSTPAPTGLIISADPYFRYFRTAFTAAIGSKCPIPVCYPFHDYIETIGQGANYNNSISLDLPRLNSKTATDQDTAYYQLGLQAGKYLQGTMNVMVVKWNGAAWSAPG